MGVCAWAIRRKHCLFSTKADISPAEHVRLSSRGAGDRATFARHLSSQGVPRFYLHVCNGNGFTEDTEGQEFADIAAARRAAIKGLREIMAGEMQVGELDLGSFIEIEDANHEMLATVSFDEAVRLRIARGKPH